MERRISRDHGTKERERREKDLRRYHEEGGEERASEREREEPGGVERLENEERQSEDEGE